MNRTLDVDFMAVDRAIRDTWCRIDAFAQAGGCCERPRSGWGATLVDADDAALRARRRRVARGGGDAVLVHRGAVKKRLRCRGRGGGGGAELGADVTWWLFNASVGRAMTEASIVVAVALAAFALGAPAGDGTRCARGSRRAHVDRLVARAGRVRAHAARRRPARLLDAPRPARAAALARARGAPRDARARLALGEPQPPAERGRDAALPGRAALPARLSRHAGRRRRARVRALRGRAPRERLVGLRAAPLRDREPALPPLAPRGRPRGARQELREPLPDLGPRVRHVPHAARRAADDVRPARPDAGVARRRALVALPPRRAAASPSATRCETRALCRPASSFEPPRRQGRQGETAAFHSAGLAPLAPWRFEIGLGGSTLEAATFLSPGRCPRYSSCLQAPRGPLAARPMAPEPRREVRPLGVRRARSPRQSRRQGGCSAACSCRARSAPCATRRADISISR